MKIKWFFFLIWIICLILFFVGQYLAPSNYYSQQNNPWGNLFGTTFVVGSLSFVAMIIFSLLGIKKNKVNIETKREDEQHIMYRPSTGFTIIISVLVTLLIVGLVYLLYENTKLKQQQSVQSVQNSIVITPTIEPSQKNQQKQNTNTSKITNSNIECIGPDGVKFWTTMDECKNLNEKWGKEVDYMTDCVLPPDCGGGTIRMSYSQCMKPCGGLQVNSISKSTNQPKNEINAQSTSQKVAFNATETTIKGNYYCYENKVNFMVTEQSLVKTYRETYEICKDSSYNKSVYSGCATSNCSNLTGMESSTCYDQCFNKAYGQCNDYYKTYLNERSKLDNMKMENCP